MLGKLASIAAIVLILNSGGWAQATRPSHQKADFGFSYLWIETAKTVAAAANNPFPGSYTMSPSLPPPLPNWSVGIIVIGVTDKSAAAAAGLTADDLIVQVDGHEIESADDATKFFNDAIPGKHYKLVFYRYDATMQRWNPVAKEIVPDVDINSIVVAPIPRLPHIIPTTIPDFDAAYLKKHRNSQKWEYGFIDHSGNWDSRIENWSYESSWTDGEARVSINGGLFDLYKRLGGTNNNGDIELLFNLLGDHGWKYLEKWELYNKESGYEDMYVFGRPK